MASLETRLHLIRASTVGLDVGVDRKISSSYEHVDCFQLSLNKLQLHQQYLHAVSFPCLLGFLHMENPELWLKVVALKTSASESVQKYPALNSVMEEDKKSTFHNLLL